MKATTKRLSSTVLAILILVGAVVVFFELVQPEYTTLMTLKGKQASEQDLLTSQKKLVTQAQSVLATYQSQASSTQAVNLAMPMGQNSATAIAQIYGLATNSALSIQGISISLQNASQSTQTNSNSSTTSSLLRAKGSVTFQISASGSYEALKTFLQGLEANVRVFDVTGLSVHPVNAVTSNGVSQASTQDLYTYSITAVAYYQSS